jgi:hypothetical protein
VAARLKAFAMFWYDFVIGDDWRVAAGVVAALGLTYGLSHSSITAWWCVPAAAVVLLTFSVWRAARGR